jgi:Pyruvate/2-oxoacid:ferredoxin oxidoreductase delta subunit
VRRALAGKGARDVGYFHARGADRFLGYLKLGYLFSHDHPTYDEIVRAEAFGREVAQHATGTPLVLVEEDRRPSAIYRLERFLVNRWLIRNLHSRLFRVDTRKCTACDICMKLCPAGNLHPGEGGRPVWGRDCLLCLTCEEKCPKEAIASPVTSRLFRPFLRYNIRIASRDPAIGHVRVAHRKGRTDRIGR